MSRNGMRFPPKYSRMFADAPLPQNPLTEISDNKRVLIEHHKGIGAYSCYEIHVNVRDGYNCIEGSKLQLECISSDKIVITGQISCVKFYREANHARKPD